MKPRDYQERAISQVFDWVATNNGNPCLEIPTGGGKTLVIAEVCKRALSGYPGTRILILSHVKELLAQARDTLVKVWPNAPVGVYSAGLNQRTFGQPITIAGIQSLRKKFHLLGEVHIVIVDEAHLIGHRAQGLYRELVDYLTARNPKLRVIGLTATPYRLGHGLITDKPAIFSDILRPTSIEELIFKGYLSPLRSKLTGAQYDVSAVHKRGGDYVESELTRAIDTEDQNYEVAKEIVARAGGRQSWLVFCTGVSHALHMRDNLRGLGVNSEILTGEMTSAQRDDAIRRFKAGEITCLTNVGVLTTGFDFPGIDLIAMCRPTLSPGLYSQIAGRGLRIAPGKKDCLFLDFAGVVATHGPITAIQTPDLKGEGKGEPPIKICDNCHELVHMSARKCPACGEPFGDSEPAALALHDDDVMEVEIHDMDVAGWEWSKHVSRNSGKEMLKVAFYGDALDEPTLYEYLCIRHDGYAFEKAKRELFEYERRTGLPDLDPGSDIEALAGLLNGTSPPERLAYKRDGKFWRIIDKTWGRQEPMTSEEMDREFGEVPF